MKETTIAIIRAGLQADSDISAAERNHWLALLRNGGELQEQPRNEPRLLRRAEGSRRLGIGLRAFDGLCKSGALQKVKLPGRKRACGVRETDLIALMEGRAP